MRFWRKLILKHTGLVEILNETRIEFSPNMCRKHPEIYFSP
jgi:hypothetical protein